MDVIPTERRDPALVDFIENRYAPAENVDGF